MKSTSFSMSPKFFTRTLNRCSQMRICGNSCNLWLGISALLRLAESPNTLFAGQNSFIGQSEWANTTRYLKSNNNVSSYIEIWNDTYVTNIVKSFLSSGSTDIYGGCATQHVDSPGFRRPHASSNPREDSRFAVHPGSMDGLTPRCSKWYFGGNLDDHPWNTGYPWISHMLRHRAIGSWKKIPAHHPFLIPGRFRIRSLRNGA